MQNLSIPGLVALALVASPAQGQDDASGDDVRIGHSAHGAAFDEGPRERPWKMTDIGSTHFPITTSVPEVQEWFDQGNTLLHSFWYYEAERSFRWCLKLDPDCAMAWWGLARAVGERRMNDRAREVLREAVQRKDGVTDRERMYIEAWEKAFVPELSGAVELLDEEGRNAFGILAKELELIVIAYPDDVEAKALLALYSLYSSSRVGNDLILREVFEREPLHPGAHHYNIHNWDGPEGAQALHSCAVYGQLASYVGHANHMPGHIYSGIGMWHEAAIWMDSATRVEKDYMNERMIFPFNHWNHAHNRNYLSYIQEQLGMPTLALDGGAQLMAAPLDPKYNDPDEKDYSVFAQGQIALLRGLVKFERWGHILDAESMPWRERLFDRVWRPYCEGLAHLHTGDVVAAIDDLVELKGLEQEVGEEGGRLAAQHALMLLELRALVALEQGEVAKAVQLLAEGVELQFERYANDPPSYPRVLSNVLGETHLALSSPVLAARAFERTLEEVRLDAFALSGLARALHRTGDLEGAARAYGRLLAVWSDAEPGLRWLEDARALGLEAEPLDDGPAPQRRYASMDLTHLGPDTWEPYPAPPLAARDMYDEPATLEDHLGNNVVLVFFLGKECAHCVDQLVEIDERIEEFRRRDTDVLAISSDTPETNRASQEMGELGFALLSDEDLANAKRFHSYDDFEEIELHSTIFIDRDGRIRWARTGGDPFMDLDFLLAQIDRAEEGRAPETAIEAGAPAPERGF